MEMALTFNNISLTPVTHQTTLWIRAVELARALGYSSEKSITNIYNRNRDEFSNEMSVVINLSTTGTPAPTRIFSLRGCHLLAMFARTPVAKQFRRWVLDVLDRLAEEERAKAERVENPDRLPGALPDRPSRRTDPERKQLTAIINTWVGMAPVHYASARAQVNAHFGVASVDALTVAQVKEAITWVQAKIDALPPAPEQLALPAHSALLDERANNIRGLVAAMNAKRRDFLLALQEVEFAVRFRPVKMDDMVSMLSKTLERHLPVLSMTANLNLDALCDLLDVYCATLSGTK